MLLLRRSLIRAAAGAASATFLPATLAACGGISATGSPAQPSGSQSAAAKPGQVQAVIPSSDLAVGRNRVALALLQVKPGQSTYSPIADAQLSFKWYFPIEPQPVARGDVAPQFRYVDDKSKGLYVAQAQFDQPGVWGVEVTGTGEGGAIGPARIQFQVKPKSDTPAIGSPAPRSKNPTRFDVDDIKKIDSGPTPNDMHDLSIAAAIEQRKPLVVAFASPGFCVTLTCAPELGEVQKLKAKYKDQANFVHVEIYKDPQTRTPWETVTQWGLQTEPWVFLVDRDGNIADKFEGPAPLSEIEPALQKLL